MTEISVKELRKKLATKLRRDNDNSVYIMRSWFCLSNDFKLLFPISIEGDSVQFYSVEACYKYYKYNTSQVYEANTKLQKICLQKHTSGDEIRALEKHLINQLKINSKWDSLKDDIMYNANLQKYKRNPHLAKKLFETKNRTIIAPSFMIDSSGQPWGDTYWEILYNNQLICLGGKNKMGKILISIRSKMHILESKEIYFV